MKPITTITSALLIAASSIATHSMAQDKLADHHQGFYIGGALGKVDSTFNDSGFNFKSSDDNSIGIYGGYNFSNWFGLEASFNFISDLNDGLEVDEESYGSLTLTPKLTWQMTDRFGLFGKVGLTSAVYTIDDSTLDDPETWSGLGETYSLGAELGLGGVKLRLSYDKESADLENIDDNFFDIDSETESIRLGIHYQF